MLKTRYPKILASLLIIALAISLAACNQKNKSAAEQGLSAMNALLVQDYLKQNISELSPEKEVLGGKFYITNLKFVDDNNAEVNYEDGHIALKAKINFVIELNTNGEEAVKINSFKIIDS